jgi:ribonucleoside-diphosphate reductase alpha chain
MDSLANVLKDAKSIFVPTGKDTLKAKRFFTRDGQDPFDTVKWKATDAVLRAPDGTEKFRLNGVIVPEAWSDRATNIVAEKYFRVCNGEKETSARQMISRVADTIALAGVTQGLFDDESAKIFRDELCYILLHQMFAFNSPVWFNIGVPGVKQQASACFIQSVDDTMDSITQLIQNEMHLFKGGSGTGSNISTLRSSYESLSGGGEASGPVSFMEVLDAGAGVTKSGGTTRRAAKMVVMNADHPDILVQKNGRPGFITCKSAAEQLAHDLIDTGKYSGEFNVPGNAYERVGFQNANNSVRVTDQFMEAYLYDKEWRTVSVTTGEVIHTYKARQLWNAIAEAAWFCGDPGIQFDTTTNKWHTCKASGRINASNPCSEYLFLDDTACNLGSFNLLKFYDGSQFMVDAFIAANQTCIAAMEILVGYSEYPSAAISKNSHDFRPLGIGYANLGALLMHMGYAYDSDVGRSIAGGITALMSGTCYAHSATMANILGPFAKYKDNKDSMRQVMQMHYDATKTLAPLSSVDSKLLEAATDAWGKAFHYGESYGYRNSQISVIAPTGTISFLMDCETTGIEPMLALTVFKKLVGGGYLTMPNAAIVPALKRLGYHDDVVSSVEKALTEGKSIQSLLRADHLPVFQTAIGDNPVSVDGHLKMMAAVQPFLSGGISKTVNMPSTATVQDVANAYMNAWQMGLKCVAIYRDGCKRSQPASSKKDTAPASAEPVTQGLSWGERKRLPNDRNSFTHKFSIGGQEGYIHTGFYEDGTPGEVFINMAKAGSTLHGVIDMFATAISVGLQHGVPLSTFIDKLKGTKFEPAGFTGNKDIRTTSSIGDYLGRWFEQKFSGGAVGSYPSAVNDQITDAVTQAPAKGQYGDPCSACGNLTVRAGSCWVCTSCGTTTGCG